MGDLNNMDESTDPMELTSTGISRRDMIKASVVAGGLVWAAPTLLTGKAAVAATAPCCSTGTPITINVPEGQNPNCGNLQCLDNTLPGFPTGADYPCQNEIAGCLGQQGFVVGDFTEGQADTATITLAPGVTLIAASVKAGNKCYFALCPCFAESQTDDTCPNICQTTSGNACTFGENETPLPPATGGLNRIWVRADTKGENLDDPGNDPGFTAIRIDTSPDGQLNQVELALCLAPAITGIC